MSEVGRLLKDCAWQEVKKGWVTEALERSKLSVFYERGVQVGRKGIRWVLPKLGDDTAEVRVESGRWGGLKHEDSTCAQCCSGKVEDVEH